MNYTPEETLFMVEAYTAEPSRETVEKLAVKLEKSVKSIIGKLSREGVYQRAAYKSKVEMTLSQRWNWLITSLRILELRLMIYLVSIKARRQLSKRLNSLRGRLSGKKDK